jgi:hypothetical protein
MKTGSLTIGMFFLSLSLNANCSNTQNIIKEYIQLKKASSSQNIKTQSDILDLKRDVRVFYRDLMSQKRDSHVLKNDSSSLEVCYIQY